MRWVVGVSCLGYDDCSFPFGSFCFPNKINGSKNGYNSNYCCEDGECVVDYDC